MSINWNTVDAIGSALSGAGTIVGAVAVVWTARAAFRSWKMQRVEERLMDVAEQVLTLSYRLEATASQIRGSLIFRPEAIAAVGVEEADRARSEYGNLIRPTPLIAAQVILYRIDQHKGDWDALLAIRATVLVHFGEEVNRYLSFFLTLRGTLEMLAKELARVKATDEERRAHLMGELFADGDDALSLATTEAVRELEKHLLPKIRFPRAQPSTNFSDGDSSPHRRRYNAFRLFGRSGS